MKNLVQREYPGSMNELYSVCETAIGNFATYSSNFIDFRKAYQAPYETEIRQKLNDAIELPDGHTSQEDSIILHGQMEVTGSICLRKFRLLKRYIINAWSSKVDQQAKLITAGMTDYRTARDGNWEDLAGLNVKMKNFIEHNKSVLEGNDNMPNTFQAEVETAGDAFKLKYDAFKLAEQTASITAAKITANNTIYREVMNMLQDGQAIFEEEPEVAERFVFAKIRDLVTVQTTGVKVKVKSVPDNMPATDAHVSIERPGEPAEVLMVDEEGELQRKVAAGPVKLVISAPGKKTETMMLTLEGGSYKSVNVDLEAA